MARGRPWDYFSPEYESQTRSQMAGWGRQQASAYTPAPIDPPGALMEEVGLSDAQKAAAITGGAISAVGTGLSFVPGWGQIAGPITIAAGQAVLPVTSAIESATEGTPDAGKSIDAGASLLGMAGVATPHRGKFLQQGPRPAQAAPGPTRLTPPGILGEAYGRPRPPAGWYR